MGYGVLLRAFKSFLAAPRGCNVNEYGTTLIHNFTEKRVYLKKNRRTYRVNQKSLGVWKAVE